MKPNRAFAYLVSLALGTMLLLSGCNPKSGQTAPQQAGETASNPSAEQTQAPAAPPQPVVLDVPAGTRLRVTLGEDLGSKISQTGENFSATLAEAVVVRGATALPRGASVQGTVIDAKPMGHFKGGALLAIRLDRVGTGSASYAIVTSTVDRTLKGKGKRSAVLIGGGAGLGALVGGLAGGGKGAAIGAGVGAGAGTAGAAATGNKQIVLPAGTALTFQLERGLRVKK
jgi:hypothetical protein